MEKVSRNWDEKERCVLHIIPIVDFGSQYTQLIAKRVRDLGYYSVVVQIDDTREYLDSPCVILSGGPSSVLDEDHLLLPQWLKKYEGKILGVCYGMQLMVKELGGRVVRGGRGEYGRVKVRVVADSPLFDGIPESFESWMSHRDVVKEIPSGFRVLAVSENNMIAAITDDERYWLVQFHPEVRHCSYGFEILENFMLKVCGIRPDWSLEDFVHRKIDEIREKLDDGKAICALSGGVDSSVASVLVHKAIGGNLINVFVDHGLLRKNEEIEVPRVFRDKLGMNLIVVDARERFLERLKGVTDPEKKRKIIGEEFIRVFEEEARKHDVEYLVQGTIYSDVIESARSGKTTNKIKSHHNVGGLPEKMNLKLIEPIRELFKDEVRRVGEILGIPDFIVHRHPFPGPGLAVRIVGEVDEESLRILKEADRIFIDTLRELGWYDRTWQAFAVLLPVKSVGVKGDERSYGRVLVLRAVDSVEGMTADWSRLPHEILDEAARRILNSVPQIGRVVFDITSKPPGTIEWE